MRAYLTKSLLLLGAVAVAAGAAAALGSDGLGRGGGEPVAAALPDGDAPLQGVRGTTGSPGTSRAIPALQGASRPAGKVGQVGQAGQTWQAGLAGRTGPGGQAGQAGHSASAVYARGAIALSPPSPAAAPRRELVFRLRWGSGPEELGYRTPEEAAPEGPMSFALGPSGSIWVLDQVNFRVQVVEQGRVARSVPLPNDSYQDIAVDGRGRLAVLDRLALRHVAWLEGAGQAWRFAGIEGPGMPEGGGATALFLETDGAWLEWSHQHLVRVTDARGLPDLARPQRWGRMTPDGQRLVRAARAGSHGAILLARDSRAARAGVEVLARPSFGRPLTYLTALCTGGAGRVLLGAHLIEHGSAAPFPVIAEEAWALVLGPVGQEEHRVKLPVSQSPATPFQGIRMAPDGAIYHLLYEDRGASLWRVRP